MQRKLQKAKISDWPILTLVVMTAMVIIVLPGYTFWSGYVDRIEVAEQSLTLIISRSSFRILRCLETIPLA